MNAPLLQVDKLTRHYTLPRQKLWQPAPVVQALNGVGFTLHAGRSLGIVGESGSGKSTLARLVMALDTPTSGSVHMLGRDLHKLPRAELQRARRDFQMVFQDPYGSLDPRQTVARTVAEPLAALGETRLHSNACKPHTCWMRWACAPATSTNTRMNSRAASASVSPLRGP